MQFLVSSIIFLFYLSSVFTLSRCKSELLPYQVLKVSLNDKR